MEEQKFCFIFGSFTSTSSRRPDSDLDLLCNRGVKANDIRKVLLKKYPDLPTNTRLDINYVDPINGLIEHPICYWQNDKLLELFNNSNVNVVTKRRYDIGAYLRDPDKNMFRQKLLSSISIKFSNINYSKVIDRHYGRSNFLQVLKSLEPDESRLYEKLYEKKWILHESCSSSFSIVRDTRQVVTNKEKYTFSQFMDKCLNYRKNEQNF